LRFSRDARPGRTPEVVVEAHGSAGRLVGSPFGYFA
jgi:hypothetical protein